MLSSYLATGQAETNQNVGRTILNDKPSGKVRGSKIRPGLGQDLQQCEDQVVDWSVYKARDPPSLWLHCSDCLPRELKRRRK